MWYEEYNLENKGMTPRRVERIRIIIRVQMQRIRGKMQEGWRQTTRLSLTDKFNCFENPPPKPTRTDLIFIKKPIQKIDVKPFRKGLRMATEQTESKNTGRKEDEDKENLHPNVNFARRQSSDILKTPLKVKMEMKVPLRREEQKVEVQDRKVSVTMRAILIDWLMLVSEQLSIEKESLHNAICYMDTFCEKSIFPKEDYQLVALTCLSIAYKLCSSVELPVNTLLATVEHAFPLTRVATMEISVLKVLKFKLHPKTIYLYMVLLIQTLKFYLQRYQQTKLGMDLVRRLLWIIDGLVMCSPLLSHSKEDICLSVIYLEGGLSDSVFEGFMSYLRKRKMRLRDVRLVVEEVRLWTRWRCTCEAERQYHPQLKHILYAAGKLK